MTSALDALTEQALTGRSDAAGEPAWLRDRRLAAFKRYLDQPWPDSRADEYWRSTPFTKRVDTSLELVTDVGGGPVPSSLVDTLELGSSAIDLCDAGVVEVRLPDDLAEQGVIVTDLATAAREHPDLVREHLGQLTTSDPEGTGADEDRTIAVSDAAWTHGVLVHVPVEVEVAAPIGIHLHVTRPGAQLPRVLVTLGRHAKATVYLEHTSELDAEQHTLVSEVAGGAESPPGDEHARRHEGKALVNEVVEAFLGDGCQLDLLTLNEWGDGVTHLALQKAQAGRDATYRHMSVNIGGDTIRLRPEVDLAGPGASTFPSGIYFADEGQHFDMQPYIRHIAPRATSDVFYKGALQGRSRTVFRGNVLVAKDAVGTTTDENNFTLVLTEGAKADSTPFLEILCADVTAGHGSATGQIDARHLFYLESRGVPREQALRLIVHGFFRQVLDRMRLPGVEDRALAHIEREIDRADIDRLGVTGIAPEGEAGVSRSTTRDAADVERDQLVSEVTREVTKGV